MWDIQIRIAEYWEIMKMRKLDEGEQAEFKLLMDEQSECIREVMELRDQYKLASITGDYDWMKEALSEFQDLQKRLLY